MLFSNLNQSFHSGSLQEYIVPTFLHEILKINQNFLIILIKQYF